MNTLELTFRRVFVLIIILAFLLSLNARTAWADDVDPISIIDRLLNRDPIADAGGPYYGIEGTVIEFDGSGSYDSDGTIVSWLWDFGDGESSTEQNSTHTYSQDGTYKVSLLVTDDIGETNEVKTSAEITDLDPTADFSASPSSGDEPLSVTFSDISTSYDEIISWEWDFGDGQTSTEQNPTHVYNEGVYSISLTIEEEDGDSDTKIKENIINVEPPNSPPIASFLIQASKHAINETISFTDQSSDDDGTITSWQWNFGDTTTSTAQNPSHKYESVGTYTVSLTVTDNDGASDSATRQITIHEITPPLTTNDYDGLWHNSDFSINLAASDDGSGVAETFYRINEGSNNKLSADGQPRITSEGSNNTLEYWSVDKVGNEEDHHVLKNIKLDKTAPIANAGKDRTVNEDMVVAFNGGDSTDNIQIINYTWILDGTLEKLDGSNPEYIFHSPGAYTITLVVADSAGNTDSHSVTVNVLDTTNPIAQAGDDVVIYQGENVNFDGSNSADNVGIVSYNWSFFDVTPQTMVGADPSYAFNNPGTYNVTLTVSDRQRNIDTDVLLITVVDNTWPVANAGVDQIVMENTLVHFDGSASSDNVKIVRYVWTFTDNTVQTLEGVRPTYYFENPGVYQVNLEVSDAEGHSSSDTMSVVVRDKTQATIKVQNYSTIVEGKPILFEIGNSSANTDSVNYGWVFGDGATENTSAPSVVHIYSEPGIYAVQLAVTDTTGNVDHATTSIVVREDTDTDSLVDQLDEVDNSNQVPEKEATSNEFDEVESPDAFIDRKSDELSNIEENKKQTGPEVYRIMGISLADILTAVILLSIICYIIVYSEFFNLKKKTDQPRDSNY